MEHQAGPPDSAPSAPTPKLARSPARRRRNMVGPRVSILLPVFNASETIEACLRSILRQTESNFECVLVDDGSTDDTLERVSDVVGDDARFVVHSISHQGIVAALNAGLRFCRAPLIARMDADDLMHRARLALQARFLHQFPWLSAVGSHVRLFPRATLGHGYRAYERWLNTMGSDADIRREAFVECPIAHPTLMIRRPVLAAVSYRDLGWPEDYDLVLRLLASGHRIGVVPKRLLSWRNGTQRLSRTASAYRIARFVACKAAFLADGLLDGRDQYVLWGYGPTGRAMFRALARLGKRPVMIVEVNPRKVGQVIQGARVVAPEALPSPGAFPVVVAVAGAGPRAIIRHHLDRAGYQELEHFVCTA